MDGVFHQDRSCAAFRSSRRRAVIICSVAFLLVFCAASWVWADQTTLSAQTSDVRVQGPWVYTYQTDQISIDPAPSHDLLPLLLDGNQSSVTIPDSLGNIHDYSFVLQPNTLALSNIRARCLDHPD